MTNTATVNEPDRRVLSALLLLAALLRLWHVDAPVIGAHAWRQADTAAVARNFLDDPRLLYPRVDWGGDGPGYVDMELPVYPYVTSLAYRVTGVQTWVARSISMLGSLIGLAFLYGLACRHVNARAAAWACFFYAILPMSVYFGRAIMPEGWLVGASIGTLYFLSRWADDRRGRDLVLTGCCLSLAILLKYPVYLGLPMVYLVCRKDGWRALGNWRLWLCAIIVLLPSVAWSLHAQHLRELSGIGFGVFSAGRFSNWSIVFTTDFLNEVVLAYVAEKHVTWAGFLLVMLGLFTRRQGDGERVFDYWAIAGVVYVLLVPWMHYVHEYYQVPIVPPLMVYMGKVIADWQRIGRATRVLAVAAVATVTVLAMGKTLRLGAAQDPASSPDVALAAAMQSHVARGDLVIAADNLEPTWLYLSNRKGWVRNPESLTLAATADLARRGARAVAGRHARWTSPAALQNLADLRTYGEVVYETESRFLIVLPRDVNDSSGDSE